MSGRKHQPQVLQAWGWWCEPRPDDETGLSDQMDMDRAHVDRRVLPPPQEMGDAMLRGEQHSPRGDLLRSCQPVPPVSQTLRGEVVPTGHECLSPRNPHAYALPFAPKRSFNMNTMSSCACFPFLSTVSL